jgi:D-amino-acid dehydrogenase
MMPDMMPRVGRGRRANVFYNTGHGHLGWTLSAGTADMVADLVHGQAMDRRSAVRPAAPVQAAA